MYCLLHGHEGVQILTTRDIALTEDIVFTVNTRSSRQTY